MGFLGLGPDAREIEMEMERNLFILPRFVFVCDVKSDVNADSERL